MGETEHIPRTYDEAVLELARWHAEGEDPPVKVYVLPDPDEQTVRLVEVCDAFVSLDQPEPWSFGRSRELPFPSQVIQVSTPDWQRLWRGEKPLPPGWSLEALKQVWPHDQR